MKEDIKQFLESSLLEEYVLGIIDPAEVPKVEKFIRISPEVKSAYEGLQESMAMLAKKLAIPPPPGTKESILRKIDDSVISTQQPTMDYQKWWAIAASLLAVVCSVWAISLSQQQASFQNEIKTLEDQYVVLKDQCNEKESLYAQQQEQWMMLANPKTEKYLLSGNDKAPKLETVAYWNEESQTSYLRILSLPAIPKGQCLQLWADVDGEMVNMNVLPDEIGQIVAIPFKKDATSLNVTIEPEGGSLHPNVANLVASVSI
jgi:anti-sigma-K factor RskA